MKRITQAGFLLAALNLSSFAAMGMDDSQPAIQEVRENSDAKKEPQQDKVEKDIGCEVVPQEQTVATQKNDEPVLEKPSNQQDEKSNTEGVKKKKKKCIIM